MASIDPTARVEDGAVIADDAVIGPFCMIGSQVTIGPRCRLIGHVYVAGITSLISIAPFIHSPRSARSRNR